MPRSDRELPVELFRAIAEYTYDWETWVDAEGAPRWINPAVERITGHSVQSCLARKDYPLFLVHPDDHALLSGVLAEAQRGGSGNDVEFRVICRDGRPRWVAISWQAVCTSAGVPMGYRTSVRDIEERKQMESLLNAMRKRAEAAAVARTQLLANVSHELRSPVHCIAGFADLLSAMPLADPQRRYVQVIRDQCQGMMRQVDDLLSLAALEAGGVHLLRDRIDLSALAHALIDAARPLAEDRALALGLELSLEGAHHVEGDAERIKQVLRNLLDNALKFTEQGHITLSVWTPAAPLDQRVVFRVQDTGEGMASEQLDSVLEPFHQGEAGSARRHGGVGLGLAIVQRLTQAMGGTLRIASERGRGTAVEVALPLPSWTRDREAAAQHRVPDDERASAREELRGLVVDDSAAARELLCAMLRSLGVAADEARSAGEADIRLTQHDYDFILLDYQMPDTDGAEAAVRWRRRLSARNRPRPTAIYMLTANVFAREQLQAAQDAIDAVLIKPVSRAQLAALLAAHPRQEEEAQPSPAPGAVLDEQVVSDLCQLVSPDGKTMLARLLPRVASDVDRALDALTQAANRGQWAAAARHAHALAGHGGLVGARKVAALARALEMDAEALEKLAAPDPRKVRSLQTTQLAQLRRSWDNAHSLLCRRLP